ncbi:hypothetical protein [Nocardioides nitrophenolicus]|uniref:hypothetical protein n=1 Tax=Nocardioides nitrophenolicus TaxID=60489 RepID=UPI000B13FB1A|nr:hypothetical protein [Nocardioides nitrophenolicus]MBM7519186.1 hypothetical protein [Nocardioides nitrophenolicus]
MTAPAPRETCCVIQCGEPAEYVLGMHRASGEVSIGFCSQHTLEVMPSLIDGPYMEQRPAESEVSALEAELEKQGVTTETIRRFQQLLWNVATKDRQMSPSDSETDGEFMVRILQAAVPRGLRVIAVAVSGEADWSFQGIGGGSKEPRQAPR